MDCPYCPKERGDKMNYPKKLKKGDTIGICAPSGGITKEVDIKKLEYAEKNLQNMGYKIIETQSVRNEYRGRSATVSIVPSTGENRSYYYYIIGIAALIIVVGGIVFIKKKVL